MENVNTTYEKTFSPAQRYFNEFFKSQSAGGVVLLVCTLIALVFANVPALSGVCSLWNTECGLHIGGFSIDMSLLEWVNEGLMAVFFFSVGLEIKREMTIGQLSSMKKAALPVFAALGGMIFPALIYLVFNAGNPLSSRGWGVPMATDIAFAIGILSLLGKRVPIGVKVLLTALAIADDLGSIIVLAVFYPTHALNFAAIGIALGVFAGLMVFNRLKVFRGWIYILGGIVLWYFVLKSGIHSTIAGVLLAITIPMESDSTQSRVLGRITHHLNRFREVSNRETDNMPNSSQLHIIHAMSEELDQMEPLLHKFETNLSNVVNFVIMPIFALANASVVIDLGAFSQGLPPVVPGIFFGLFCGKPLGIFLFSLLAVKLKIAQLPENTGWKHIFAMGILGGIGFTMSIFIDNLAFSDPAVADVGKVAILVTSFTVAVVGLLVMKSVTKDNNIE